MISMETTLNSKLKSGLFVNFPRRTPPGFLLGVGSCVTNAAAQSAVMPLRAELTLCLIERRCASASLVIPRSSCRVEAHAVARPRESLLLEVQLFAVE